MKKKVNIDERAKIKALFFMFFPTIIIAAVPDNIGETIMWISTSLVIKILLILFQFILIKNFVDTHYGE